MTGSCSTLFPRETVAPAALASRAHAWMKGPGQRFGHLIARHLTASEVAVELLLLAPATGSGRILSAPLGTARDYPAVTLQVHAAHWAERALGDFFGLRAVGHPRWKSLLLHDDAWPADCHPLTESAGHSHEPYTFLTVQGDGVHEIPVGPIHAGIIEPGHFRFSCVGEVITNLEIRLGYQHRGVEQGLTRLPWPRTRFLAESASSDTAAGNALAHAVAIERLLGASPPPRAHALRTIALEFERLANHIGDLGAISGDIGFSPGATLFPPLRGATLGLAQTLTGTRRQRYYILPGGVARDCDEARRRRLLDDLAALAQRLAEVIPLLQHNPAVRDRMEGTGRVTPALAREFGLVGPAGRASGCSYDVRTAYPHGRYPGQAPPVVRQEAGDVLARMEQRIGEIATSLTLVRELLETLPVGPAIEELAHLSLPGDAVGIGIVEAWRGELLHWITTDAQGAISRYAIKDPSFNNWTGLAIAVRNNLVGDFPLCNKSFNLSYCGNDL
jgi:Ni,Fe-hydrogenase III large subunit